MILIRVVHAGFAVGAGAHSVLMFVPGARRLEGVVLDTILGPAEDFEYVSTTAPRSQPPTT